MLSGEGRQHRKTVKNKNRSQSQAALQPRPQGAFPWGARLRSSDNFSAETQATKKSKIYYLLWTWRIKMVDKL